MFKKNKGLINKGVVALFPAIIISSILIILCVGLSRSLLAFLYRTTIFDDKIQSVIIAHSCALRTLAKHIQDVGYKGGEVVLIGNNPCIISVFSTTTGYVSVQIGEAKSVEYVGY